VKQGMERRLRRLEDAAGLTPDVQAWQLCVFQHAPNELGQVLRYTRNLAQPRRRPTWVERQAAQSEANKRRQSELERRRAAALAQYK
jgi:hypothetical protein